MSHDVAKIQDRISLKLAINRKDGKALSELHSKYYRKIKRYIASRISSIADAEDLTQNVFFELCKSNGTDKGHQNAEAYLLGVAKKLIALYHRNRDKQIRTISINSMDEITADIQRKPSEQISQQKLRELKDTIARLPPKTQEAISLRLIEGISIQEAAKRTGCSIHTFCQRIYQAKKIIEELKTRVQ